MKVKFHGVRGSTPSPCDSNRRYGGNTSSVSVHVGDENPIMLDLGTGAREFGLAMGRPFDGAVFVTHLHWDHIQGLPFFGPMIMPGGSTTVYGPPQEDGTLRQALDSFVRPPLFPVTIDALPSDIEAVAIGDETVDLGYASVMSRSVPHVGVTNGYRVEVDGKSVAYIPDHQQPQDPTSIGQGVAELCQDADVLIHDAQYTPAEFETKSDWGHCTIEYAMHVASTCDVKTLVLFHHDPAHDDVTLDRLIAEAKAAGELVGLEVVGAYEGLELAL